MAGYSDTSPEAEKRLNEIWFSFPSSERLYRGTELFDVARKLAIEGIKMRNPEISPRLLMELLFIHLYGETLNPVVLNIFLTKIRTGPFRSGWRKILGISDDEPVD